MTVDPGTFSYVSGLVHAEAAIVLGTGKEYLVESRLLPLMREGGFGDIATFVMAARTRQDDGLRHKIVEALTTNETSFFRDREPFKAFADVVIPELTRLLPEWSPIRIWSAACSTGQEPFSLAMLVTDHPQLASGRPVEILATDINEKVLQKARGARFSQLEVNRGLPAPMLVRHFERVDTDWRVVSQVRDLVSFRPLNLAQPFDLPCMDVVFLRNVLIYFDAETKVSILRRMRRVMQPHGYLFLGGSETTLGLDDGFERVQIGSTSAYRPLGLGGQSTDALTSRSVLSRLGANQ